MGARREQVDDARSTDYFEFFNLAPATRAGVATNGSQSGDLLDVVVERIPEMQRMRPSRSASRVGRPNVGVVLVNRLIGEDRSSSATSQGRHRDAIDTPMTYHGRDMIFVDTAGLRRQSKMDDGVEFYSSLRTRRAIERADVCVLMLDATLGLENQDLKIAALAWEAGRSLIVVVNKWDLKEKSDKTSAHFVRDAGEKAPFLKWVPFLSPPRHGQRVTKILDVIFQVDEERRRRVATHEVNEVLQALLQRRQPPQPRAARSS